MKGYVMQLQPFSVNDGEGIRTAIFMAGCPLRCKWCSNPEGFEQKPKTAFYEKLCIGCGLCTTVCHVHNGINLNDPNSGKNVMDVASAPMSVRRMRKNAWLWKKRFLKLWKK